MIGALSTIDAVTDFLFISGYAPVNRVNLEKYSITLVVDATNLPTKRFSANNANYSNDNDLKVERIKVNVDDSEAALLKPFFDQVCDKIKSVKDAGGKALVHCAAGISRSATLCIVYLMKHEGLSLKDAYGAVYTKRSIISPNNGFWRQMIEYELELKGSNTVNMIKTKFREIPDVYLPRNSAALCLLSKDGSKNEDRHTFNGGDEIKQIST